MKIAMLVPYFYPHTGGTEKYVRDLSIELSKKGHDVTIISNNIPKKAGAPREDKIDGVKIIRLPAFNFLYYLPVSFSFKKKMIEDMDVVHTHGPAFSFTRSVPKNFKAAHILTFHCDTLMFDKFKGIHVPGFIRSAFAFIMDIFIRRVIPRADMIISTTEAYASTSHVLKDFPHKIVPIGIHAEKIDGVIKKLNLSPEKKKNNQIIFLGRLAQNKGVDFLVKAMPKVLEKLPNTELLICGEGEEKEHLEKLIKKFGIEKSITFYGTLTFDKLVELYYTSTVFAMPSISRLEAFGIVQLEAMSCSTAVICTDIPGPNAVMDVGKSGLLAKPRDPDALADALIQVLSNPERTRQMGLHGRKLVETKYNWSIIADQVLEIYKEAQSKKK
jgi:N-acetyllactosaminide 3-alpha-galactosyltransferase